MADENKPAFYPRVGNIKAKNFKPAQPMPFIDDPRAMDIPHEYYDIPTAENRELSRRRGERIADLERQKSADTSPLEKLAGGVQAGRFLGSALTQAVNSAPTRLFKGDEAADKFMQERMYKPEQPLAYEYAGDVGDFLEKLETQYKLPPILPEAVALQYLTGPATAQAARAAGRGAEQVGRKIESAMEPVVKGAFERGGLPREMVMAMGANTQSNVMKPSNKANWLSGPSIHVPEGDAWRFKTTTIAGETPEQRIPRHEELLNDPTLNQDQLDRVKYQLELAKGEAALDKWADNALMGYFKGQLASPEDPVRLMIERNYANIEAKFAKDQERATKMAQRAEAELDPRKQANMKRQADTMFVQARDDREVAMQNISHLPSEMLQDIVVDPKSYIKEERVKAGYPAEGLGTTTPSRKWEHQADEAVKVTRAGDIQGAMDLQPRLDKAMQENYAVSLKIGEAFGNLLREKGLDEDTIQTLVKSMPRDQKADAVGMLDEMQKADSNYLRLLDQDRSFPKFAAQDNPFVAKLDPETKMYSGYMGDLGFEHVMDVLRQDLAAERIRPDQLNKLSVEQAVKRTQEYNLDLARKMNADRASARANLPVYKEYPDGYKWVQLNQPGNFAAESQAMGHSVKGYEPSKKHPEWVEGSGDEGSASYGLGGWEAIKSGRAKVYSLVDSKGAPHTTIEVASGAHPIGYSFKGASKELPETFEYNRNFEEGYPRPTEEQKQTILSRAQDIFKNNSNIERMDAFQMAANEVLGELPAEIRQIKGKGNAKPKDDYIPYVQDFVKSGKWTDVRDFKNTDLIREGDQIMTPAEHADWLLKELGADTYNELGLGAKIPPAQGMKRGGKVSLSNNPDTMMLELGNRRMKAGGVVRMAGGGDPSKKLSGNILAGASWNSLNQTLGNQLTQLNGMPTFNTSVGGATTADTYKQLIDFINAGGSFDPNAIVYLQTGGVDFLNGVPKDQIANNIDQILTILENQGVDVVLTGAPFATSMNDVVSNNFDPTMDPLFQDVASRHQNVALVGSMGDILQDKSLLSDNLHTNEQGTIRYNNDVIGALGQFTQPNQNTVNNVSQQSEKITQPNTPIEYGTLTKSEPAGVGQFTDPQNANADTEAQIQKLNALNEQQSYTAIPQTLEEITQTGKSNKQVPPIEAAVTPPVTPAPQNPVVPTGGLPTVPSTPDYSRAYSALGGAGVVNDLRNQFLGMGMSEDTIGSVFSKYYSPEAKVVAKEGGAIEMAGGGAISKLIRAAPKSKAEIDAIARRMAPQLLGEFVRGDKGTQSVAGKTQKQFAKEKEMKHDIRPTGAERPLPREVDIEELKDQVMVGIAGDPTISGQTLYSVDGVPLESPSPQHGGPFYGLGNEDDAFWASGLSAANRVQNIAREASQQYDLPVLGNYVMMGPDSINYAQHYADANLAAINPAKMSRGQIEAFNKMVREGYPYKKKGEDFTRQRVFPAFPGIENPSEAYLHFSIDPELRKHFNALMQMPTVTEKYSLPSGIDVRHAVTEPDLRDLEIGVTGKSIGRLRPEVTNLGLSTHPTYSHDIPGEFLGTSKYPVPYELSFPDTVKSVRENPKQAPQEFGSFKYVGPRQVIDQQLIDEIKQYQEMIKKYTGKKKGGAVHKATGGVVKSAVKQAHLAKLAKMREEMAPRAEAVKALIARDENRYLSDVVPNSLTNAEIENEIKRMAARAEASKPEVKEAKGGVVRMTKNRDTMFMELGNKKLKRK